MVKKHQIKHSDKACGWNWFWCCHDTGKGSTQELQVRSTSPPSPDRHLPPRKNRSCPGQCRCTVLEFSLLSPYHCWHRRGYGQAVCSKMPIRNVRRTRTLPEQCCAPPRIPCDLQLLPPLDPPLCFLPLHCGRSAGRLFVSGYLSRCTGGLGGSSSGKAPESIVTTHYTSRTGGWQQQQ